MRLVFTLLAFLLIAFEADAQDVTSFYFAAKRNIDPLLFQRASYLRENHGRRFLFNEKEITARDLIGISGDDGSDPNTYKDSSVPSWVFDATDLAIQITHWKKLLARLDVPARFWKNALIEYEKYQLSIIKSHKRLDPLSKFSFALMWEKGACAERMSKVYGGDGEAYQTLGDSIFDSIRAQEQFELASCIVSNENLSDAEKLFYEFYFSVYSYTLERDRGFFLVWEPTCECGNGFFSIAVEVQPKNSSLNIISEFAYKVCRSLIEQGIEDISLCNGHHQLGTGQKIYLAGDYRYQVRYPDGTVGVPRAIRLRDKDQDARRLVFSDGGHQILE